MLERALFLLVVVSMGCSAAHDTHSLPTRLLALRWEGPDVTVYEVGPEGIVERLRMPGDTRHTYLMDVDSTGRRVRITSRGLADGQIASHAVLDLESQELTDYDLVEDPYCHVEWSQNGAASWMWCQPERDRTRLYYLDLDGIAQLVLDEPTELRIVRVLGDERILVGSWSDDFTVRLWRWVDRDGGIDSVAAGLEISHVIDPSVGSFIGWPADDTLAAIEPGTGVIWSVELAPDREWVTWPERGPPTVFVESGPAGQELVRTSAGGTARVPLSLPLGPDRPDGTRYGNRLFVAPTQEVVVITAPDDSTHFVDIEANEQYPAGPGVLPGWWTFSPDGRYAMNRPSWYEPVQLVEVVTGLEHAVALRDVLPAAVYAFLP